MFKSRSGSPGTAVVHPPQSIEAVRRRARHRLMGAIVLVLLGVLGFPLLFDTQPRPIAIDIPIEIPAKSPAATLALRKPAPVIPAPAPGTSASEPSVTEPRPEAQASGKPLSAQESLSAREEMVMESTQPVPAPSVPAPTAAPVAAASARPAASTEAARAQALLDGKPVAKTADGAQRIVVQVGAFADPARAREVRLKVEAAGLKTYTHVAQTAEGSRIRVRVGPFSSRAEADKAASRVKALGLPAAVLTL